MFNNETMKQTVSSNKLLRKNYIIIFQAFLNIILMQTYLYMRNF